MSKYFNPEDYTMNVNVADSSVVATLTLSSGEEFTGIATYHEGDDFDVKKATNIAKAKSWRKLWNSFKKDSLRAADAFKTCSDHALDQAMSFNKRESELNSYIEKLTR